MGERTPKKTDLVLGKKWGEERREQKWEDWNRGWDSVMVNIFITFTAERWECLGEGEWFPFSHMNAHIHKHVYLACLNKGTL